ncbi:MAG: metallophosphoesterase [Eubacteriales bacterium]|nr:metallophosphoesterase [Eubacteriales bacterium]
MRRNKNLVKKAAAVALMAAMVVGSTTTSAFAYNEYDVSKDTFRTDTDNSTDFKTWRDSVWQNGDYADSAKVALTPGQNADDLNFAWYSVTAGKPAVMVWKEGAKASAKVVEGTAEAVLAENWQGSAYKASNKVAVNDYFEAATQYFYAYTDNYTGDAKTSVWSSEYSYKTGNTDSFSVILTGDPQIGASGSSDDYSAEDSSTARDTYNWNKTMEQALDTCPDAAFLLSAGDQINQSGATSEEDKKTRESEYAGYLYPSIFRSLPIASTIGNHDMAGADYSQHFNNPNSSDKLGTTAAGGDYYFTYGDVLFISLNSNNRNQSEHRTLMNKAVASNPDAKWKVVIFHSDIYGSGQPHADTDATANRVIFAPLMDEFDVDICLTGHDHTYSRSYQILDGNVIDYDISSGKVADPEGTLYITTGSGSGSKYYNLLNYTPYYIAERTNACLPAFSTIDFTGGSLTIKTYDYTGAKYADDFTITKTDSGMSVDEVIASAETKLSDTSVYTEASVAALKNSLAALTAMKNAYTTAADPMIATISAGYGTETDIIKGYGSIVNASDKDMGKVHRLKAGMSTLLDKTIYTQLKEGVAVDKAVVPVVDAAALENAKAAVVTAINSLEVKKADAPADTDMPDNSTADSMAATPQTGDSSAARVLALGIAMLTAIAGAAAMIFRKKEEICEK